MRLNVSRAFRSSGASLKSLAASRNGTWLATGDAEGVVSAWNILEGSALWSTKVHDSQVTGLSLSRTGRLLATASSDASLRILDTNSGDQRCQMRVHGPLTDCQWMPTGASAKEVEAAGYQQQGLAAEARREYDKATSWYYKCLGLYEDMGDQSGIAVSFDQLGKVAQARGSLDEAEEWYSKSLKVYANLGDLRGMSMIYEQLGAAAQTKGILAQARQLYGKSKSMKEAAQRQHAERPDRGDQEGPILNLLAVGSFGVYAFKVMLDGRLSSVDKESLSLEVEVS
jgi:tetratricopeptide (TPR) repeat protein